MNSVIITERYDWDAHATVYRVRVGGWEESLWIADLELLHARSVAPYRMKVEKIADRLSQFDRLVREDRDF